MLAEAELEAMNREGRIGPRDLAHRVPADDLELAVRADVDQRIIGAGCYSRGPPGQPVGDDIHGGAREVDAHETVRRIALDAEHLRAVFVPREEERRREPADDRALAAGRELNARQAAAVLFRHIGELLVIVDHDADGMAKARGKDGDGTGIRIHRQQVSEVVADRVEEPPPRALAERHLVRGPTGVGDLPLVPLAAKHLADRPSPLRHEDVAGIPVDHHVLRERQAGQDGLDQSVRQVDLRELADRPLDVIRGGIVRRDPDAHAGGKSDHDIGDEHRRFSTVGASGSVSGTTARPCHSSQGHAALMDGRDSVRATEAAAPRRHASLIASRRPIVGGFMQTKPSKELVPKAQLGRADL